MKTDIHPQHNCFTLINSVNRPPRNFRKILEQQGLHILKHAHFKKANAILIDLSNSDLSKMKAENCNFWGANLQHANLQHAKIINCILSNVDLRGANLRNAILYNTELRGAKFDASTVWPTSFDHRASGVIGPGVDLKTLSLQLLSVEGMDLHACEFSEMDLTGCNFSACDLRNADFSKANLTSSFFCNADLRGANFFEAILSNVSLVGARYNKSTVWPHNFDYKRSGAFGTGMKQKSCDMRAENLNYLDLNDSDVSESNFSGMSIYSCNLENSNLRLANFQQAQLYGLNLSESHLEGTDFTAAVLIDINLLDATYNLETRWPKGFDYKRSGAIGPKAILTEKRDSLHIYIWQNLDEAIIHDQQIYLNDFDRYLQVNMSISIQRAQLKNIFCEGTITGSLRHTSISNSTLDNLIEVNMQHTQLDTVDLQKKQLHNVDFRHARLKKVLFQKAFLFDVNFEGAVFSDCQFDGAIYNANTQWPKDFDYKNAGAFGPNAILCERDFRYIVINKHHYIVIDRHNIEHSHQDHLCFQNIQLEKSILTHSQISYCDLKYANLCSVDAKHADWYKLDLRHADLRSINLSHSNLCEIDLRHADLRGAIFEGSHLFSCQLQGAIYDDHTVWPKDFPFSSLGAIGPGADLSLVSRDLLEGRTLNLQKADFRELNLREIQLNRQQLSYAKMSAVNLQQANLQHSTLIETDLRKSDLRGCNFSHAILQRVKLKCAIYDDSTQWPAGFVYNQQGALGPKSILIGINISRLNASKLDLHHINFSFAILKHSVFASCSMQHAILNEGVFDHSNWEHILLQQAELQHSSLRFINLRHALLCDADLQYADLRDADLSYANLSGSNLYGADLSRCQLKNIQYDDHTIWPEDFSMPPI